MLELPGHTLLEVLYSGKRSSIYRGRREADGESVILKLRTQPSSSADHLRRLMHELAVGRCFDDEHVIGYFGLLSHDDQWVLIVEDFGGIGLNQLIPAKGFPVGSFLDIAVQAAAALAAVHRQDVIHKDVKPSNLVWNPTTSTLKIIDFGISTRLREEGRPGLSPQHLEGSLAYMSPEQTGRLHRTLDSRTDLYSLGVTFYEMLTGELPFRSSDPLELIHAHVARTARPPHEVRSGVPELLSKIVLTLLAKDADDRYRTARGLESDLRECLDRYRQDGRLAAFRLGRNDVSPTFKIPDKLYGRKAELAQLHDAFDRAASGGKACSLLLLSGVGKSALVAGLQAAVLGRRGHLATGRHEEYQQNVPYRALGQALEGLVHQLLATSEEELEAWRRRILAALGSGVQVLIEAIPSLELLLGAQDDAPPVPPREARHRFHRLLRKLLTVLAREDRPLVLFLTGLQWADKATLELLVSLAVREPIPFFLLVGGYRTVSAGEVTSAGEAATASADGGLTEALAEILAEDGAAVETLHLENLTPDTVAELLADTLQTTPAAVAPLAEAVTEKTLGNPFSTHELLKSLAAEKVLSFGDGAWHWDVEQVRATDVPDDVVDLLAVRMARLEPATLTVLKLAACLGERFEAAALARLHAAFGEGSLSRLLWTALAEGLIHALDEDAAALAFEDASASPEGRFRFAHPRIHQAADSLLGDDERARLHLAVARELAAEEPSGERLFEVVEHFYQARRFVTGADERRRVARLSLAAGRKAKQSAAFLEAATCLDTAVKFLGDETVSSPLDPPEGTPDLFFSLHRELAEVEYLAGRTAAADERCARLLARARDDDERLAIYHVQQEQWTALGRFDESLAVARTALSLSGIELPDTRDEHEAMFRAELARLEQGLRERFGDEGAAGLVRLPAMTDRRQQALTRTLNNVSAVTYFLGQRKLMAWAVLRRINTALAHGNDPYFSALTYAAFSFSVAVPVLKDYAAAERFAGVAVELAETLADPTARGRAFYLAACIHHWYRPLASSLELFDKAFDLSREGGNPLYAHSSVVMRIYVRFLAGHELSSVYEELERRKPFLKRSNPANYEGSLRGGLLQLVPRLLGRVERFEDDDFDEEQFLARHGETPHYKASFLFARLYGLYLFGRLDEAAAILDERTTLERGLIGSPALPYAWCVLALTLAGVLPRAPEPARTRYREVLDELHGEIRRWAASCALNCEHESLLIEAETAKADGDQLAAMRAYKRAVTAARDNGFPHREALGHELFARAWLEWDEPSYARIHLRRARDLYAQWGAIAKMRDLVEKHRDLLNEVPETTTTTPSDGGETTVGTATQTLHVDFAAVMKASRAISRELRPERLLAGTMRIVVEAAGAQRGRLLLERSGKPFQVVDADHGERVAVYPAGAADPALPEETVKQLGEVSQAAVDYVRRTGLELVVGEATRDPRFATDPYVLKKNVRSLLCVPVLQKTETSGILYLENNLISHAFTGKRLEILRLLLAQAAISWENALLVEKLENQNAELERFTYTVSHDLKSPLVTILGFLGVLKQDLEAHHEERVFNDLEHIRTAATTMHTMLAELLELSRIGRVATPREPVSIAEVAAEAVGLAAAVLAASGAEVVVGDGLPTVVGDRVRLREVFQNLVENAARFMGDQGSPRIEVGLGEKRSEDGVLCYVRDNGIGIAPAYHERVFNLFERLDPSVEGTGIGLALARRIVEAHGGKLWVESEGLGHGSTFWIRLPGSEAGAP